MLSKSCNSFDTATKGLAMRFNDNSVIITGGGKIGKPCAMALTGEGASVSLPDIAGADRASAFSACSDRTQRETRI